MMYFIFLIIDGKQKTWEQPWQSRRNRTCYWGICSIDSYPSTTICKTLFTVEFKSETQRDSNRGRDSAFLRLKGTDC